MVPSSLDAEDGRGSDGPDSTAFAIWLTIVLVVIAVVLVHRHGG